MSEQNITRIPVQHMIFVKEYIRHGDKERAYAKAYPNAQPQSRKPAAWRLSRRREVQELIEEKQKVAIEKGFAAAEAEAADRYKKDFLSLYERRAELARIVRRQARMNKYYKVKEEMKTMDVPVDHPSAILRAIELDTKLEAEYFAKKPATEKSKDPWHGGEKFNLISYIGKSAFRGDEDDLSDEEYDYAIKQSLTSDDYKVTPPTLIPKLESLGCYVHRDMETGKYEIHCPADRVIAKVENGETKYYELTDDDKNSVTSGNIDGPQETEKQHEEQKSLMRHQESQNPDPKGQISNPGRAGYRDQIPDKTQPTRRYFYPIWRGGSGDEWVSLDWIIMDYWDYYIKNQNSDNMRLHEAIVRLSRSRNRPPEERREIELETGWEFHPKSDALVRRIRM